jgi:hypothetical protein
MKQEQEQDIIDFCKTNNITVDQFYGNEIIEINRNIFLEVKTLPHNFTPTIKNNLILSDLTSIPNNFNPKIGGYLYVNDNNVAEELLINYNYDIVCYDNIDIDRISEYMHRNNLDYFEAGIKLQEIIDLDELPILNNYIKALNRNKIIENIFEN